MTSSTLFHAFTILMLIAGTLVGCSTDESNVRSSKAHKAAGEGDATGTAPGVDDGTGGSADQEGEKQQLPQDDAHQKPDGTGTDQASTGSGQGTGTGQESSEGTGTDVEEPALALAPALGMRNFRQINDAMASLTGVPRTTPAVAAAFSALETQLPDSNDLGTFNGSHQVAISKLAVEYCDAMINDAGLATAAVPGFDFNALPSVAFNAASKESLAKSLLARFWGTGLESLPPEGETLDMISELIDSVVAGKANTAVVTKNVVKGVCVSLLASVQVLMY
jgi:hypothetical protein